MTDGVNASPQRLVCRLRKKTQGRAALSPLAAEVELESCAGTPLDILVQCSLWQYLDLVVEDADGRTVSEWHYGNIFSPLEHPYTLRIGPAEKRAANVLLLANVPEEARRPGRYSVRAVFAYDGLRAESEPLWVDVPAVPDSNGSAAAPLTSRPASSGPLTSAPAEDRRG